MNLTDWFDGDVKPHYVGVYKRELHAGICYTYFDGVKWRSGDMTPERAEQVKDVGESNYQDIRWRGLTEPHCKKCSTPMLPGTALAQTAAVGTPDFPGGEIVTHNPGGSGRLIDCLKCPTCGWSMTK